MCNREIVSYGSSADRGLPSALPGFRRFGAAGRLLEDGAGQLPTGRPERPQERYASIYMDELNEPLYPFGYGLSYSRFTYANPRVSAALMPLDGTVEIPVDITNSGLRDGQEVAQLYIRQAIASLSRSLRELKGSTKVMLAAGETRAVRFRLEAARLGAHDDRGRYVVDPGEIEIYLGGSSRAAVKVQVRLQKI